MKAKPSNLKPEVREERQPGLSLAIDRWDEECFPMPVRGANAAVVDPNLVWDDIEAVGAADDASRFRIDQPLEETVGACP